jgi:glycosyltransferase involved in cell wall biosynthesis
MDILHTAETVNGYSFQALRAKRRWGGALVVTAWETLAFNFEGHPLNRRIKQAVRDEADHFIAVTTRARDCLVREGVEPHRISVIPAGVDLSRFCPGPANLGLRAALGLESDRPAVLFMGRLVPEKGVYDLLRAFHHLRFQHGLEPNLLMVGGGRCEAGLRREARDLGLEERFHLTPPLPYEKTPEVYRLAEVFVLPSRCTRDWEEQFGMVLVEAMACGTPIVAADSGAISEVVGDAGLLVPPDSPVRLAEGIARVLKEGDLRAAGIRRARENFSHLVVSRRIEEVYRSVLERAASAAEVKRGLAALESEGA